jgi:H+-transporting ATPase
MWNPLSWVMEAAAIMAIGLAHGGVSLYDSSTSLPYLLIFYSMVSYMTLPQRPEKMY